MILLFMKQTNIETFCSNKLHFEGCHSLFLCQRFFSQHELLKFASQDSQLFLFVELQFWFVHCHLISQDCRLVVRRWTFAFLAVRPLFQSNEDQVLPTNVRCAKSCNPDILECAFPRWAECFPGHLYSFPFPDMLYYANCIANCK